MTEQKKLPNIFKEPLWLMMRKHEHEMKKRRDAVRERARALLADSERKRGQE
ncbi:hypothetical protein [Aneurinibacillus tyrosinisolvens]|uniref:hypothetical protein n=1 Tax=Aneurinibacillus tyrosinisolvens TaxID=1443435 RepID=UPI000A69A8BF|nr:hypothetical protein [Aneurinibacillus tyrosinisolvens]